MQLNAKENNLLKTHLKISKVVDGDGIIARNIFDNKEIEIRLLGIDAPELKICRKLKQDEKETHLAAHFLIELGRISFKYLLKIAPPNTNITISMEENNILDLYGRTLAYVYLEDGTCLNEKMVLEGYAKPFNRFYCKELTKYQILNLRARNEQKGLFAISNNW